MLIKSLNQHYLTKIWPETGEFQHESQNVKIYNVDFSYNKKLLVIVILCEILFVSVRFDISKKYVDINSLKHRRDRKISRNIILKPIKLYFSPLVRLTEKTTVYFNMPSVAETRGSLKKSS